MTIQKNAFGRQGEELAAVFLKEKGYRLVERNYRTPIGEIDIIAFNGDTICFIEVKRRTTDEFGSPLEAITKHKQKKLTQLALFFLKKKKWLDKKARFDIVAITKDEANTDHLEVIQNAFDLTGNYVY